MAEDFFWKPAECCGVVGIYCEDPSKTALKIYNTLFELYNRGHESCGIAVYSGDGFDRRVRYRPIYEAFDEGREIADMRGFAGIGHNRYSTRGESDINHAQPLKTEGRFGEFYIAHNGTIRNAEEIRRELEAEGETFKTNSDTEVLAKLIGHGKDIIDGIKTASRAVKGSYSLVILSKDGIYAVRDPNGIKPLCLGRGDGSVIIASESCAFNINNGTEFERDIKRGEIFYAGPEGEYSESLGEGRPALDIFELIYFARADSIIDGIDVAEYRMERGRRLARREFVEPDEKTIVVPVPYSGIDYAIGYHEEISRISGRHVPYREALLRKRHARSFIMPEEKKRESVVMKKISVKGRQVEGKRIMLIDDSTVRGTTDIKLSRLLRNNGAKEIHKRNGYAPVIDTCPFGIDMKTREEHIANRISDPKELAKALGFDSIMYNLIEDLIPDGYSTESFCLRCVTSKDPLE